MKDTKYLEIIKAPVITEKSQIAKSEGKYTFKVSPKANKTEIKEAIEKISEHINYDLTNSPFITEFISKLKEMIVSGQLSATNLVWKEGMKDWVAAETIEELFEIVKAKQ